MTDRQDIAELIERPNPGSAEAIEQGCTCPVIDNHHGRGVRVNGRTLFWSNADCPLHLRAIEAKDKP